jgi:hypothetical protein
MAFCLYEISNATGLLPLAKPRIMLRYSPLENRYMLVDFGPEWCKPREYSFTNAAGKVFYEIAYSRYDVRMFAEMHKAISYKRVVYPDQAGRDDEPEDDLEVK